MNNNGGVVTRNEIILTLSVLGMTAIVILMLAAFKIDSGILAAWASLATFIISRVFGDRNASNSKRDSDR